MRYGRQNTWFRRNSHGRAHSTRSHEDDRDDERRRRSRFTIHSRRGRERSSSLAGAAQRFPRGISAETVGDVCCSRGDGRSDTGSAGSPKPIRTPLHRCVFSSLHTVKELCGLMQTTIDHHLCRVQVSAATSRFTSRQAHGTHSTAVWSFQGIRV